MCVSSFRISVIMLFLVVISTALCAQEQHETIAVWLFDELPGLYPSAVIHDAGPNDYVMVLGRGGQISEGRFNNALEIIDPRPLQLPEGDFAARFGLTRHRIPEGRTVTPMTWHNAFFSALMTSGESHLRKQVGFVQPTATKLNLGDFDWTVEFWFRATRQSGSNGAVVFEIGEGPRGENDRVTRLMLNPDHQGFTLVNQAGNVELLIPSDPGSLSHASGEWHHYAFVYSASDRQLSHFVDGHRQRQPERAAIRTLDVGDEDYFTLGRDGLWNRALPGKLDELRFSSGMVYTGNFNPPGSFSELYLGDLTEKKLKKGKPLLFSEDRKRDEVVDIGSRKHLFIDDILVEQSDNVRFNVNPPKVDELVMRIEGSNEGTIGQHQNFRKHITLVEDEDGLIRLYNALDDDYLGVWISEDGVHFEAPETGIEHKGNPNIVIPYDVGTGTMIIDPNAPPEERWKYISDYHRRGVYVFTSPDGYNFNRHKQAVAPFRSGSQMDLYYDDQKQIYTGFHRSDFFRTPEGRTLRTFVMTEKTNLLKPWPFQPSTPESYQMAGEEMILHTVHPWYLDNGPLTPGGWGVEYPHIFKPDYNLDPETTAGIYNPKALKYPWAPDTYLAFPVFYLYYYEGTPGARVLAARYGGGPTETQFAAGRDGVNWTRYPRPTYVGMGRYDDIDMMQSFIVQGMVKRGEEIWQYVFFDGDYHTSAIERQRQRRLYRLVQRMDGFVSIDAPYDSYGTIVTRPLRFEGNRLLLNIKTDAHGYALVSLLDEDGNPIDGYSLEQSVMINGDHIGIEAEWIQSDMDLFGPSVREFQGLADIRDAGEDIEGDIEGIEMSADIGALEGRPVRVKVRLRGASLYSMQFTK